jgi:hypothetical protein
MTTPPRRRVSLPTLCLATLALASGLAIALGPLNPPSGAVSSSNRTLQEIYDKIPAAEGRTFIPGGTTPVTIGQPGVYVLTGNITTTGIAMNISTSSGPVTIDLNGFTISSSNSGLPTVNVSSAPQLRIRNGVIGGGSTSLALSITPGAIIEDITIVGPRVNGVTMNGNAAGTTLRRCTLLDIGSATLASDTQAIYGVFGSASGVRIEDCTLSRFVHNGTTPGNITGIQITGNGGLVNRCIVYNTTSVPLSVGITFGPGTTNSFAGNNVHNFASEYANGLNAGGNN